MMCALGSQVPEDVVKAVAEVLKDSKLLTVREDGTGIKRSEVGTNANSGLSE